MVFEIDCYADSVRNTRIRIASQIAFVQRIKDAQSSTRFVAKHSAAWRDDEALKLAAGWGRLIGQDPLAPAKPLACSELPAVVSGPSQWVMTPGGCGVLH
jgi:hypothetical protein